MVVKAIRSMEPLQPQSFPVKRHLISQEQTVHMPLDYYE